MIKVLDKGYIELQSVMGDDFSVVTAARVSYLGESKGYDQDKKLLFYLMEHRHTTPFEMVQFKFRIKCPLFVRSQWMRHRTWSYNEVSRRYTSENIEFYIPTEWREQDTKNKQGSITVKNKDYHFSNLVEKHCFDSVELYNQMLEKSIAREMARMVLPQNLYTEFIASVDAHNLMHFLKLRMNEHAQWEIQQYAIAIYENFFKSTLPWTAEAFEKFN